LHSPFFEIKELSNWDKTEFYMTYLRKILHVKRRLSMVSLLQMS